MHLDEGQIQRVLHRELADAEVKAAQEHLTECSDCRNRLAEATREEEVVLRLLGSVDHPAPRVAVDDIAARAQEHRIGRFRWAAGVILALGAAGAAYAVPGSPVRGWVAAVAEWIQGRPEPTPLAPVAPRASEPGLAGIAVIPGPRFVIQFTTPQAKGRARVSLTKGTEVVVQGPIGAATFTSGVDRLVIENAGSTAGFDVQIPEAATWVEIRVGDARILLKEGGRVTTAAPAASAPFLLPLKPNGGIP